jgi:hypothetical protein
VSLSFWLGTHEPSWLRHAGVPLFISTRRLQRLKQMPVASVPWALDSGGFTELSMFGEWRTTPAEYVDHVRRYADEVGRLEWVAPQDWMCEPFMLGRTGLSVPDHQALTIRSFLDLREQLGPLVVPVLQGYALDDYRRHRDAYVAVGVDLDAERLVGLGSVCRRQATGQAEAIVWALQPIALHGFGMKTEGLRRYGAGLASADSMAWSFQARKRAPLPGCSHKSCANCVRYALEWRARALAPPRAPQLWSAA